LAAEILPETVKQQYQTSYLKLLSKLSDIETNSDYNVSNPTNYKQVIKEQINMCLSILQSPTPVDSEQQLETMVRHCERWDRVYGYNAKKLYPEFEQILKQYDYNISG
jgi:hypothetical protein